MKPREKLLAAGVLLVFAGWGLDRWALSPLLDEARSLDRRVAAARARLRRDRQLLSQRERIESEYRAHLRAGADKDASGAQDMTAFLKEIETLGRSSGVKLKDVKPRESREGGREGPSVAVAVDASWDALARFLQKVQQSPQLLSVEKAAIQIREGDGAALAAQLTITRLLEDGPLPGEDPPARSKPSRSPR